MTGKKSDKNVDTIKDLSFEECFAELQALVDQFEKGQMPLSESVDCFERGMKLLKHCNKELNDAEKRVEALLERIEPRAFDNTGMSEDTYESDDSDLPY